MQFNTTPEYPAPPDHLIEAAARDLPSVLADMPNEPVGPLFCYPEPESQPEQEVEEFPNGHRIVRAANLVSALSKQGHSSAAAAWAIHRIVQDGLLSPTRVDVWWESKPNPTDPVSFDLLLVVSKETLWERWRNAEPKEDEAGEGPGSGQKIKNHLPRAEANILARQYLRKHPEMNVSARQLSKAIGVALGTVPKLAAWQVYLAKREAKIQVPLKGRHKQLTDKMMESIGMNADPSLGIEVEEAAWDYLLNKASPRERKELLAKKPGEKAKLIQSVIDHFNSEV